MAEKWGSPITRGKDNTLALHGFGARMSPENWVKAIAHLGTEAPQFLQYQRFTEEATPGHGACMKMYEGKGAMKGTRIH